MTGDQLDFDGGAHPYPMPPPHRLTERQRELLRWMRWATETGSPMATGEARRFYVDAHGALRRLEAMGRVRKTARGRWKPT